MFPRPLVEHVTELSSPSSDNSDPLSTSLDISKKLNLLHWKNVISNYFDNILCKFWKDEYNISRGRVYFIGKSVQLCSENLSAHPWCWSRPWCLLWRWFDSVSWSHIEQTESTTGDHSSTPQQRREVKGHDLIRTYDRLGFLEINLTQNDLLVLIWLLWVKNIVHVSVTITVCWELSGLNYSEEDWTAPATGKISSRYLRSKIIFLLC